RDFDLAWRARRGDASFPSTRVYSWWWAPSYLEYSWARLEAVLQAALREAGEAPVSVLFSAHGIPQRYDQRGDPYVVEMRAHFADHVHRGKSMLARHAQGRHAGQVFWELSFQSRVGPVEWVRPYTDATIAQLGKARGGTLLVVPVSFTSDHIETL